MSASGQKRSLALDQPNVRFAPEADIPDSSRKLRLRFINPAHIFQRLTPFEMQPAPRVCVFFGVRELGQRQMRLSRRSFFKK
jgi:hypothetical protein